MQRVVVVQEVRVECLECKICYTVKQEENDAFTTSFQSKLARLCMFLLDFESVSKCEEMELYVGGGLLRNPVG